MRSLQFKLFPLVLLASSLLFAQYKVETGGAAPQEASALASAVSGQSLKVLKENGSVLVELWLVKDLPGGGTAEENTAFPNVPHGALIGVAHFPARHSDRRGQTIKPGYYTLRYSRYPVNGDHMGVAPQRDFAVLSLLASDKDAAAKPDFATLMKSSFAASGTPHPLVLSIWKEDQPVEPGVESVGDEEKVLHVKLGGVMFSMIIVGEHAG